MDAVALPLDFPALPQECAPAIASGAFTAGTLAAQLASNALHLAQPLLIAELTGSLGQAAFFSSFDTAVHMAGTFVGGWPADRLGPRRLLILSISLRGAVLAVIPMAMATGRLTPLLAMTAYTVDAFIRGFIDTAEHTLPLALAGNDAAALDRLNSRYEFAFDLGAVAGPLLLGASFLAGQGVLAHAAIPLGFFATALILRGIPQERAAGVRPAARPSSGTLAGIQAVLSDPGLRLTAAAVALLNLYPLRKLLSSFFAKAVLKNKAAAGWVGAAFGLGGVLGALLYGSRGAKISSATWVALGAAGVLALSAAGFSAAIAPMLVGGFVFALLNTTARLALTRRMQEATPLDSVGGVTGAVRFAANGASVLLKALLGAAFAMGGGPRAAFAAVSAGLIVLALIQIGLAARLRRSA